MDDMISVHSLGGFQASRTGLPNIEYVQPPHEFLVSLYDDPILHQQHVFPGAKRAVPHAQVLTWQQQGLSEGEMVALVNERWVTANAHRVGVFEGWRDGPRVEKLKEHELLRVARAQALAELEARLIAEQLAKKAD